MGLTITPVKEPLTFCLRQNNFTILLHFLRCMFTIIIVRRMPAIYHSSAREQSVAKHLVLIHTYLLKHDHSPPTSYVERLRICSNARTKWGYRFNLWKILLHPVCKTFSHPISDSYSMYIWVSFIEPSLSPQTILNRVANTCIDFVHTAHLHCLWNILSNISGRWRIQWAINS